MEIEGHEGIDLDHIFYTATLSYESDSAVREKLDEISESFEPPERFSNKLSNQDEDNRSNNFVIFATEGQASTVLFRLSEDVGTLLVIMDLNDEHPNLFEDILHETLSLIEELYKDNFHAFYRLDDNFLDLTLPLTEIQEWEDKEVTGLRFTHSSNEYILQSGDEFTTAKFIVNEPDPLSENDVGSAMDALDLSLDVLSELR